MRFIPTLHEIQAFVAGLALMILICTASAAFALDHEIHPQGPRDNAPAADHDNGNGDNGSDNGPDNGDDNGGDDNGDRDHDDDD